ncbi:hypothetical protein P3G55_17800 [Leptospira sp. 96542]|nr:hypothetical protein [Leptospira sp. 96542]
MRQNLLFLAVAFLFSQNLLWANGQVALVHKAERTKQGELLYNKAKEFFYDRNHWQSIEHCKLFLLLYPSHPKSWELRKLLSSNYRMTGDTLALAENELSMYKEYPNTEEGLESYLISGKAYVRLGREDKAYQIFHDITKNTYSSKIAQEAELELTQMEILGEGKNK